MIVVDASACIETLLNTQAAAELRRRMFATGETLHAPHLLDIEVTQVLRRFVAMGEISDERAKIALDDLADLRMHRYPHDLFLPRVWTLRHNLTAYDAIYVALAEALGAELVTCDRRLASAAGRHAKIIVVGSSSPGP